MAGGAGQGLAQRGAWVNGLRRPGRKTALDPYCHCRVLLPAAPIYVKELPFFFKQCHYWQLFL